MRGEKVPPDVGFDDEEKDMFQALLMHCGGIALVGK